MKALRAVKFWLAVTAIAAIWVIGVSGPICAQDKAAAGHQAVKPTSRHCRRYNQPLPRQPLP